MEEKDYIGQLYQKAKTDFGYNKDEDYFRDKMANDEQYRKDFHGKLVNDYGYKVTDYDEFVGKLGIAGSVVEEPTEQESVAKAIDIMPDEEVPQQYRSVYSKLPQSLKQSMTPAMRKRGEMMATPEGRATWAAEMREASKAMPKQARRVMEQEADDIDAYDDGGLFDAKQMEAANATARNKSVYDDMMLTDADNAVIDKIESDNRSRNEAVKMQQRQVRKVDGMAVSLGLPTSYDNVADINTSVRTMFDQTEDGKEINKRIQDEMKVAQFEVMDALKNSEDEEVKEVASFYTNLDAIRTEGDEIERLSAELKEHKAALGKDATKDEVDAYNAEAKALKERFDAYNERAKRYEELEKSGAVGRFNELFDATIKNDTYLNGLYDEYGKKLNAVFGGWVEEKAMPMKREIAKESFNELSGEIQKQLDKTKDNRSFALHVGDPAMALREATMEDISGPLEMAVQLSKKTDNLIKAYGKGNAVSLGKGFIDQFGDMDFASFGATAVTSGLIRKSIMDKVGTDFSGVDKLTEDEKIAYDALCQYYMTLQLFQPNGWYKAGQVTAETIPFIFTLGASGSIGEGIGKALGNSSKAWVKTLAKAFPEAEGRVALSNIGRSAARITPKKFFTSSLPKAVARTATEGFVYAGTTGLPSTVATAIDYMMPELSVDVDVENRDIVATGMKESEETWASALRKGFLTQAIEGASEAGSTYMFEPAAKYLGGRIMASLGKNGERYFQNIARATFNNKGVMGQATRHLSGALFEYTEEMFGGFLRCISGLSNWDEEFNGKNLAETAFGLAPMEAVFLVMGGGNMARHHRRIGQARTLLEQHSPDSIGLYERLSGMSSYEGQDLLDREVISVMQQVEQMKAAGTFDEAAQKALASRMNMALTMKEQLYMDEAAATMHDETMRYAYETYTSNINEQSGNLVIADYTDKDGNTKSVFVIGERDGKTIVSDGKDTFVADGEVKVREEYTPDQLDDNIIESVGEQFNAGLPQVTPTIGETYAFVGGDMKIENVDEDGFVTATVNGRQVELSRREFREMYGNSEKALAYAQGVVEAQHGSGEGDARLLATSDNAADHAARGALVRQTRRNLAIIVGERRMEELESMDDTQLARAYAEADQRTKTAMAMWMRFGDRYSDAYRNALGHRGMNAILDFRQELGVGRYGSGYVTVASYNGGLVVVNDNDGQQATITDLNGNKSIVDARQLSDMQEADADSFATQATIGQRSTLASLELAYDGLVFGNSEHKIASNEDGRGNTAVVVSENSDGTITYATEFNIDQNTGEVHHEGRSEKTVAREEFRDMIETTAAEDMRKKMTQQQQEQKKEDIGELNDGQRVMLLDGSRVRTGEYGQNAGRNFVRFDDGTVKMFNDMDELKQAIADASSPAMRANMLIEEYQAKFAEAKTSEAKAAVIQEYLDKIKSDDNVVVLKQSNMLETLKARGVEEEALNNIADALHITQTTGQVFRGVFVPGVGLVINADGIASIDNTRSVYVHERQHGFTNNDLSLRKNNSLLAKVIAAAGRFELDSIVMRMSNSNFYLGKSHRTLADEFISHAMEIAYRSDDVESALREAGVTNEKLISIIKQLDDEQRTDQRLSQSRLTAPVNGSEQGDNRNDVEDSAGEPGKVGGQGPRPDEGGDSQAPRGEVKEQPAEEEEEKKGEPQPQPKTMEQMVAEEVSYVLQGNDKYLDNNLREARRKKKAADKRQPQATDKKKYEQQKEQIEKQRREAEDTLAFWEDVKAAVDAFKAESQARLNEAEEALSQLDNALNPIVQVETTHKFDKEPANAEEAAAQFLVGFVPASIRINEDSLMQETGWSREEVKRFRPATTPNGGISIQQAGEALYAEYEGEGHEHGWFGDDADAKNVLINAMHDTGGYGNLARYINDRRSQTEQDTAYELENALNEGAVQLGYENAQDMHDKRMEEARNLLESLKDNNGMLSDEALQQLKDKVNELGFMGQEEQVNSEIPEELKPTEGDAPFSVVDPVGAEELAVRYSIVTDPKEIERLDNEPYEIGYRTVALADDNTFRSPMADRLGKGGGRIRNSSFAIDRWERSDENPQLADENGKIDLENIGNVDYNPYIHIRPDAVNTQFKAAWRRPELVYVRTQYPASELTSGYQAEKAKLPVGRHDWSGGSELILSRWDKPVEVVPWEEVADDWMKKFGDKPINFDIISPHLLPILAARGANIVAPHNGMGKACNDAYNKWKAETPLSKTESPSYSITTHQDADYMDAVNRGDMETAQRMVDYEYNEYIKNHSYSRGDVAKLFGGILENVEDDFEVFGIRFDERLLVPESVFPHSHELYQDYMENEEGEQLYPDGEGPYAGFYDAGELDGTSTVYVRNESDILKALEERYDGRYVYLVGGDNQGEGTDRNEILIDNAKVLSVMSIPNKKEGHKYNTIYHEQFTNKSQDPVTYDDDGNVIPLSKRFNKRNEDIRYSVSNANQAVFVSNAARAADGIKQEKATPEQWLKMIEKQGGLKAGEDKWIGLSQWLKESDAKTLTKQEVLDFINENAIRIEEVEYGGEDAIFTPNSIKNLESELQRGGYNPNNVENTEWILDEWDKAFNDSKLFEYQNGYFDIDENGKIILSDKAKIGGEINSTRLHYTTEGLKDKREIALTVPTIEPWNESDTTHFGDAGGGRAVAWVRFGETTDKDGNKVLVIDEIQSKRHQEGREKGYGVGEFVVGEYRHFGIFPPFNQDIASVERNGSSIGIIKKNLIPGTYEASLNNSILGAHTHPFAWSRSTEKEALNDLIELYKKFSNDIIPDAPFEKNWHELAMKRMLRYAAENGYDKVAWTTGEQQAERYDLSKQVDAISYIKNEDGTYEVHVTADGDSMLLEHSRHTPAERLSDLLGKEIAQKIINGEGEQHPNKYLPDKILTGVDLKVGGEGMKGFYDKMLPSFMNKYGKQWGVKVEEVAMPNLEEGYQIMHSVDVTDAMRESVMEGQPMFSFIGRKGAQALDFADREMIRLNNRAKAMEMERNGIDPKTIKLATGWEKGKDKEWRYEIPDYYKVEEQLDKMVEERKKRLAELRKKENEAYKNYYHLSTIIPVRLDGRYTEEEKARYRKMRKRRDAFWKEYQETGNERSVLEQQDLSTTLEPVVREDSQLLMAYPQLKSIKVVFKNLHDPNLGGDYDDKTKTIRINTAISSSLFNEVFAHEVQHAIQSIEGFAKGGNPSRARQMAKDLVYNSYVFQYMMDAKMAAESTGITDEYEIWELVKEMYKELGSDATSIYTPDARRMGYKLFLHPEKYDIDRYRRAFNTWVDGMMNGEDFWSSYTEEEMFKLYSSLAGEVEARNTSRRLGMTEEERRTSLARDTEDVERRNQLVSINGASLFSVTGRPMTMKEATTQELLKLAAESRDDARLQNDATRAATETLAELMLAMRNARKISKRRRSKMEGVVDDIAKAQARYDAEVADRVTNLTTMLLRYGNLDNLSRGEVTRLLAAVKNSMDGSNVMEQAEKIVDVLLNNQLKQAAAILDKQLKTKASKVNESGVREQGSLDIEGQRILEAAREGISLDYDEYVKRLRDVQDKLTSPIETQRLNAELDYQGLMLAQQYRWKIATSEQQEKSLERELREQQEKIYDFTVEEKDDKKVYRKKLKPEYKGKLDAEHQATKDMVLQTEIEIEDSIRALRMDRAEAYNRLSSDLARVITRGKEAAKAFRDEQLQRIEDIHHNANSDLNGVPADEHFQPNRWWRFKGNAFFNFLFMPQQNFDEMLRFFAPDSADGKGYLFNRFMKMQQTARDSEWASLMADNQQLDSKVSEKFGEKMKWQDLYAMERKLPTIEVEFMDDGEMKQHTLTQGNALYIYMVNKMSDGAMKLRAMGITQEKVDEIAEQIDPRFIEIADWIQDEFLPKTRDRFNEVHMRLYGAPMAAIENYFPLKVLHKQAEELGREDEIQMMSSTPGAIKERTRNINPLDVTRTDAFSLVIEHINEMEHWAAYAEMIRDLNTLLSYKRFRNRVNNMSSARFGKGKDLFANFKKTCEAVTGTLKQKTGKADKAMLNIAKGVTASKINFRLYTAMKQVSSMPAFWADADIAELAKGFFGFNPVAQAKAWKWAIEELPGFSKRWQSRFAGNEMLDDSKSDWDLWRNSFIENASRIGMSPNAFVDAVTVAMGSKMVYESKLKKYKKQGYDDATAKDKALQDAWFIYNESQQSNDPAFLSIMQAERSWLGSALSLFRNASFGYGRRFYRSLANLKKLGPENRNAMIEYTAKQGIRDGLTEEQAYDAAKEAANRLLTKNLWDAAVFGYIVQFAWNLMPMLPYLIGGDDDDKKKEAVEDVALHSVAGPVEGMPAGNIVSSVYNDMLQGGDWTSYDYHLMPLINDINSIRKKYGTDKVAAINDMMMILMGTFTGVDPRGLTDIGVAIWDACNADPETSKEVAMLIMRIAQIPQSQIDQLYLDEVGLTAGEARRLPADELAKRYAAYKMHKNAPLTSWAYDEDQEDKVLKRYEKKFYRMMDDRLDAMSSESLESVFNESNDPTVRKAIGKRTAADMGEKDTEGETPSKSWLPETRQAQVAYQNERTYDDMKEDVALRHAIRDAEAEGDTERKASLEEEKKELDNLRHQLNGDSEHDAPILREYRNGRSAVLRSYNINIE